MSKVTVRSKETHFDDPKTRDEASNFPFVFDKLLSCLSFTIAPKINLPFNFLRRSSKTNATSSCGLSQCNSNNKLKTRTQKPLQCCLTHVYISNAINKIIFLLIRSFDVASLLFSAKTSKEGNTQYDGKSLIQSSIIFKTHSCLKSYNIL